MEKGRFGNRFGVFSTHAKDKIHCLIAFVPLVSILVPISVKTTSLVHLTG